MCRGPYVQDSTRTVARDPYVEDPTPSGLD